MIKYGLILIFVFSNLSKLSALGPSDICVKTTEGKEFWFGFMENRPGKGCGGPVLENYLEVTVTSRFNCQFTISLGKSAVAIITDVLQPNIPKKFRIDRSKAEPFGSENIEEKAIHLVSTEPLNLYAMNYGVNSADASVIFPIEALGNEYYAMCYKPHIVYQTLLDCGTFLTGKNSEFVVVASEDNTKVTIIPTQMTDRFRQAYIPFTITLSKGELFQVQSMNLPNLPGQGDLTGSYIKSDKPIALYSGSWGATVPSTVSYAVDHLYEQIPPVRSWGRKFVAVPLKSRGKDIYRVLASVDQTTIKVGNKIPVVRNRGGFYEFILNANEPSLIESDHPVLLAQYSVSNDFDRPPSIPQGGAWDGDPSMLIISPVDQTRENVTFVAYDTPEITTKLFVNVVTKDDAVNQIQLDNNPIPFTSLPNSGYSYAQVQISKGNHNLSSLEAGKGFIAYVYGFGGVESYGYGVGYNLTTHLDLGGDFHFVKDTISLCNGETKIIGAGSDFSSFLWNTGETTQKISISKKGFYEVTASTPDGCVLTAGIYAFESKPVINLGKDILCQTESLLDAGIGFSSYLWSTGEITQKIPVKTAGTYSVTATDKYGCPAKDTIQIGFGHIPKLYLSKLDTLICGNKTTSVNITADIGSYQLKSIDPTVTIKDLSVTVPQFGSYPFTFIAVDQYGCTAETKFNIGFHEIPTLNLGNDTTICNPRSILLDAGAGLTSYLWSTKDTLRTIKVQTPGNYGVVVRNKYGCPNQDNIQVSFVAIPKLDLSKLDTLNCGTKSTIVHISADRGTYFLNSSDPAVTINGLTANVSKYGSYSFNFKATDQYTCKADTNFTIGFHKIPTVNLNVNDTTCYNYALEAKYLGDAEISRTKFTWMSADNILASAIGKDNIQLLFSKDQYPRNLYLKVEENGCTNFTEIPELNFIPVVDFSVSDTIHCEKDEVRFTASNSETVVDYLWTWGDGTQEHLGKEAVHTFQKNGTYNIQLSVSTDKKCSNSIVKQNFINVSPIPAVGFSIDPETCLNPGSNSLSYVGTATGKDKFIWDLSRLDPVEVVQSPGNSPGPLIFDLFNKPSSGISLQVISENGCKSEVKSLNFKRKPVFSFDAGTTFGCAPLHVEFKGIPGDPVDQIDYHWNFGDGGTLSGQDVTHTFLQPDHLYDIAVRAVSNITGCSDTIISKNTIYTYPKPKAGFSMNPEIIYNDQPQVSFLDQSKDAVRFDWDFGDGTRSNLKNPSHKYELVGARKVLQTVYNQFNCSDTTAKDLVVALKKIYIPNAFYPDAANLIDREFKPFSNGVLVDGYHLKILSRWNDVIFECKNEIKGWNGKLSNGSMAPIGNYIWILEFVDFLGKAHRQSGTVMLVE